MFFKLSALTALCVTVVFLGSCGKKTFTLESITPRASTSKVITPEAITPEASTPESSTPKVTEQVHNISHDEALTLGRCLSGQQDKCEQAKKIEARIVGSCNGGYRPACADIEWLKKLALKSRLQRERMASIGTPAVAVMNCKKGIETECVKMREIESKLTEWCSETGGMKEWCALLSSMEAMKVSEPVR